MATSRTWAQEVISCDLCVKPTQQFCNNCQLSLCVDCVSKHVDKLKYQQHDIVHFRDRKIQLNFPECEVHTNQRCEAHCQRCDVPVCLKCMLGPHNGHKYRDMSEIFNDKKNYIDKETKEIESTIIPQYKKKNEETESKISIMMAKIDEMEKEKEMHRKSWHQEVDTIFNNLGSLMKSMKENLLAVLKSHQSKINNRIPDMTQTVQRNKEIIKSNNVSAVTNYQSKLKEYRNMPTDIDVKLPSLKTNTTQGRELSLELGEYKASLTQTTLSSLTEEVSHLSLQKLLDQAKSITTIPTGVDSLYDVACVGVDEAWYGPKMSKSNSKRVRQPSIKDSSSSEEETLKENEDFKKEREKHRENKEMNNFISLLDTTLKMNKDDDKSEEDEDVREDRGHRRVSEPSKLSDAEIHRSASLPSVETLCNADSLTTRIQILHRDCVRGVGFDILHKAFEILSNIEDDELEPQLVDLMGKDKFDQYAGKIWQLKFCNECFEQLPHLRN